MGRTTRFIVATALCTSGFFGVDGIGQAQAGKPGSGAQILVYEGKLQNAAGGPISGIFPVEFGLFRRSRGGKAKWKETHFVAVDSGSYVVELGRRSRIRGSLDLSRMHIGVKLAGKQLLREPVQKDSVTTIGTPKSPAARPRLAPVAPAAPVRKNKDGRTVVDYAEEAGEAYVAGQAKVAERIGSMTAKEIEDAVNKLKKFKGGATIGTTRRYTELAGGTRGVEYTLSCPKGHVVTGITGGAGLYIDSMKLICQPLE